MFFRIFLVLVLFCFASATFAEGDAAAGRIKAETCLGCHAVTGYYNVYPTYHVPKLGGQSAGYIESALKAYRSGTRIHGSMQANASDLSDEDIADIAVFMASIK
jgi:cytochrome c553